MPNISDTPTETTTGHDGRWWQIVGGVIMNLAFGNIYAWSVFVTPLERQFGWRRAETATVFTIAICMTAFTSWLAGWIYDGCGPSICAFIGGTLLSLGFVLSSFTHALRDLFLYFGVIGGVGTGLGCTVIITVLAKWFPDKRGLAVGLIVGAFSASSAIVGPLAEAALIPRYGVAKTFEILGVAFFAMTMTGAAILKDPPPEYRPAGWTPGLCQKGPPSTYEFTLWQMLRTPCFYLMWLGYALGCTAGLMVISQVIPYLRSRGIASQSAATVVLILGAVASVFGRVLSGWMSDKLGRLYVLRLMVAVSALAMPVLYGAGTDAVLLYSAISVVYFCYGTQFSVNAATCADFWGVKHVGLNYGVFITAWGMGGIIGPRIGGVLYDKQHSYRSAFLSAGLLAGVALLFELLAQPPVAPVETGLAAVAAHSE